MPVIKGVLKEELANSKRMKGLYERKLKTLPRGSITAKKIKSGTYYYLQYRRGDRKHFRYLGKLSSGEIAKYMEAKHLRARYRNLLSKVKKQIKFLERAVRAKTI